MRSPAGPDMNREYSGRATGIAPISLSIEKAALQVLREHAVSSKMYGRFVSRLLYEFAARQQERERLRRVMTGALEGEPGRQS